jgi:4-hydroxy-3-polyprenylbenzoate decarboxylase
MPYVCLAMFLEKLELSGELVRIAPPVDASLEVAEITRCVLRKSCRALVFGEVRGHAFALLTNLLGTDSRLLAAFEVESLDDLKNRILGELTPPDRLAWHDRLFGATTRSAHPLCPKTVRTGPCQQVVRLGKDVDLGQLPVLRTAPQESHPTITAGVLLTVDAATNRGGVGRYDVAVLDAGRLAVGLDPHDEITPILAGYAERGAKMPVAIALGGDPALFVTAVAPLPFLADVLTWAGVLRNKPIEMVRGRSLPLDVPADAEMILEGFIDPAEPPVELGLSATPSGRYRKASPGRVIHVTAMTHRTNPIFPALVRSRPPNEETVIQRAMQKVFLPLVLSTIPDLVDWSFPAFGAARHCVFAAIRKTHPGQARRVAHALWGLRQTMFAKTLIVVDEGVDIHDSAQVFEAIAAHVDPGRDVFFQKGPTDPWDAAAPAAVLAERMAIDATAKWPGESSAERWGEATADDATQKLVADRWNEYGLGRP